MDLTAMRFRQKEIDIYVTIFKASALMKCVKVDVWEENNPFGYQRPVSEARIRRAIRYLVDEDGTFPTSILLNVRGKISFSASNSIDEAGELGVLNIPETSLPFWIIDGQHRLMSIFAAALKNKSFWDYSVPVCIFNLDARFNEMRQFYIVNSRQKAVPTDLVQRHLYYSITERGEWQISPFETEKRILAAEAVPIVDILNTSKASPWQGQIQLPGEIKSPKHIVRQTSIADSIGYIIKNLTPVERDDVRKNPETLAGSLIDYWNAIKRLLPDCFDDPKSYVLQKTTGCYVFHMVFPIVWRICREAGDVSSEKMESVLESMLTDLADSQGVEMTSDFWHTEFGNQLVIGTSMKIFRTLASLLASSFMFPE
jgi:DGQHR domain-containing protein